MKKAWLCAIALCGCGSVTTTESKDLPTIDTLSPSSGSIEGGTMVTMTGTRLNEGMPIVIVGGHLATMVTATSSTMLTFALPPGDAEGATVDVQVANDSGFADKPASFTYNLQPRVLTISPTIGKGAGGVNVTISGRGFMDNAAGTATVMIAGTAATNVTVVNDQTLTATTGPAATGTKAFTPLDVTVSNANGTGTLEKSYEITAPGLIVIDRFTPSKIYHFDPATGHATQISTAGEHLNACTLNPATGVIYAIGLNSTTGNHELVTLDPLSGTTMSIGATSDASGNRDLGSITFDGSTMYGLNDGGRHTAPYERLVTVNTSTGAVNVIGATPQAVSSGNSIASKDASNVYYAGPTNSSLDTIAVSTSIKTTGVAYAGGTSAQSIGLVNTGTTLYLVERNSPGGIVYSVDTGTGVLTKLGTISSPALVSGMCQTPSTF